MSTHELLTPAPRIIKMFRKVNYSAINETLLAYDWSTFYSDGNIESALTEFYSIVNAVISKHVPKLKVKINN